MTYMKVIRRTTWNVIHAKQGKLWRRGKDMCRLTCCSTFEPFLQEKTGQLYGLINLFSTICEQLSIRSIEFSGVKHTEKATQRQEMATNTR